MKTQRNLWMCMMLVLFAFSTRSQSVSTRTSEFEVDLTDPTKLVNSVIPVVSWVTPVAEINYVGDQKFKINVVVESNVPIKSVTVTVKESTESPSRGMMSILPHTEEEKRKTVVDKSLNLMDGNNVIEIVAETIDGAKTITRRTVTVGSAALSDASKLDRTDYAVLFVTNKYDNWPALVNPVNDGRLIAEELKKNYGFKVEIIEEGSQSDILKKLREYGERKYKPLDQLFIFFAGHGQFDQTFGEGYVVTRESLANDEAKTTYLSHNRLRSIVNNVPCEHVFLAMDVCFGGTFDQSIAHRGMEDETYKEASQAEMVQRKLTYKTRRYLTSGGKEYVPDGRPGMNSPFARKMLEALRGRGGKDRILTMGELDSYVESLKPQPRSGEFGDNAPGSDFIFIVK